MQKSSIYVGITITAQDDDGNVKVRYHGHGPDYHDLEYADTVAMEGLMKQFAPEYDELALKVEEALLQAGYANAGINPGAPSGNAPPVGGRPIK